MEDVKQDQKENEVATNNKLEKPEQWNERMHDAEKFQTKVCNHTHGMTSKLWVREEIPKLEKFHCNQIVWRLSGSGSTHEEGGCWMTAENFFFPYQH